MEDLSIPINGKLQKVSIKKIEIGLLALDEMNPRISFFRDNQPKNNLSENEIVFALTQKRPEAFRKLKDSIENNRGIISPIWIEPIKNDMYRVVEGNSRVVSYQQLAIDQPYEENWKSILAYVLPERISDEDLNFIRLLAHLRGTNEWDAYEKAKYLYKLWKEEGWSVKRLEKQTKLSEKEITNNIEAYKIMEEQYLPSHYESPNETAKFSYFVEYVRNNKLKNALKKNNLDIYNFVEWVADDQKIPTGQDVRMLKDIIENDASRPIFLDKGFNSALHILELKEPKLVSPLYKDIENTIDGLKNINASELDDIINDPDSTKIALVRDLVKWSSKVLSMITEG